MPIRRQSSNILYPFTPDAETSRSAVSGVLDALFVVKGVGTQGPYGYASSSASTDDEVYPVVKTHFGVLYEMTITSLAVTYIFYVKAPGFWQKLTFDVPINGGIVRVAANEDSFSFIVVNTGLVSVTPGTTTEMWVELEPSRLVYQLDEIRSIRLTNEYRDHDTGSRPQSVEDHADATILHINTTGETLRLVDGYNCALSYDEAASTLTINGSPGFGKGLPDEFPWDTDALDIFKGIKSVNAQNVDGNLEVVFKESIRPEYGDGSLTMHVMED